MSFMFNPCPCVDPEAVNFPELAPEVTRSAVRGSVKAGALLAGVRGVLAPDGWLRPEPRPVREGLGVKEEIVGEHDLIYFSLRRLSFEHAVSDCTNGRSHVLTLVEGDEVLVYSKADPSCCFHQKFMDVVVVPASVGEYGIIDLGNTPCKVHKTLLK